MKAFSQLASVIVLIALAMVTGGCLVMKGHDVEEAGVKVSASTLSQITPGETTEAWLLAALGEPTCRRKVDEHISVLRYEHRVTTEKGAVVLFIFAGGESQEQTSAALFEVTDGVVTRYWTEA